jgi:hypothetical protein
MNTRSKSKLTTCLLAFSIIGISALHAQAPDPEQYRQRSLQWSEQRNTQGLAEPFKGVTTDGSVEQGLFEIRSTGISTASIATAANDFLATLNNDQQQRISFGIDDEEWRKWANQHIYYRDGISFDEMSPIQREAAQAMLGESLSARGLTLSNDIMHLNTTLGELNGDNFVEYGEGKYWITIMGTPSATEPWGWQLDGHHLNLNYFVLGDQVVMTPAFWGSEPAVAESGEYAGTAIMEDEQRYGLAMVNTLNESQRAQAILETSKTGNNIMTQAFSDNVVLDSAGIKVSELTAAQKQQLMRLIGIYVGNMREGHQGVRMAEIEAHLDDTWFAWVGETTDDAVFYYRIQSPVVLIEFDHETPVGLRHMYPRGVPYKEHIHAVVRTPNGNDYGKDILRQHYLAHPH